MKFKDADFKVPAACSTGGVFNCVTAAVSPAGAAIRDTKDAAKTTLTFSRDEWTSFIVAVKRGQYDIPG